MRRFIISSAGVVDFVFVGSLGGTAIAAVGVASQIHFIVFAVLSAVTTGTVAMVARSTGAGEQEEVDLVTTASVGLSILIGLVLARNLIDRGGRYLALLSRREPSPEIRAEIAELEKDGAVVRVIRVDVSDRGQLREALEQIDRELPPIRGVAHAAGVLDDGDRR